METNSQLPTESIKMEPDFEMKPHKLMFPAFIKREIKQEADFETDFLHNSAKEIVSEDQVCDKMDTKMPESAKLEQPEENVNYPELHPCSQSSQSLDEQPEIENIVFSNKDWTFVKEESSGILCQDTNNRFSKIVGVASSCNIQETAGPNNTEYRMPEDTTPITHREVSLNGTENGYTASQAHASFPDMLKRRSSNIESNTKQSLTNENCQLLNVEMPAKYTQVSERSPDHAVGYPSCSSERTQAVDTSNLSDVCGVTTSVNTFLHKQKTTDTGEKPYKCDVCEASFTRTDRLKRHMRTHTGEKPYKCDVCDTSFSEADSLKSHMRTHTGEKPYKCVICSVSFNQAGTLKCHMRTHTGEKPYKCDTCVASFTHSGNLKAHMRTHTGEKPYKCDICDASFAKASSLNVHVSTHTGFRPYKCDICDASFTRTDSLKCHIRTHTGEKPYNCKICGAAFTLAGDLTRHMRTHTREKHYKCTICAATFLRNDTLKYHIRTHTGEKPYKCDVCYSSFTKAGDLTRHMRTHTGEKPYKCEVCGISYAKSGSLKCHRRTHTGEIPSSLSCMGESIPGLPNAVPAGPTVPALSFFGAQEEFQAHLN
ncbi:hypothetical protein BsWGS_28927 [Bradybaena similaris]